MLQAYCQVTSLFVVPPGASGTAEGRFGRAAGAARSGHIGITTITSVCRGGQGRLGQRATLRNALNNVVSAEQFIAAGARPDARAEQLDVAEFIALANAS
jgi:16S rRNA (adenine1518-N6/adenine1519-N6)-dimethyltransferase